VDIETCQEVGQGMPGELHVRGPTVMIGYLGKPAETAAMIDVEGWLRTGDIAFVDKEGFLHVIDRLKELIKVNGLQVIQKGIKFPRNRIIQFKVAPAELEDLLLSHPDIQDCAIIGVPDPTCGEFPKAFVVKKDGAKLTEKKVQAFVKGKGFKAIILLNKYKNNFFIAAKAVHYKQLKGGVEFVDTIPKSPAGKILRRLLRDRQNEQKKKDGGKGKLLSKL
jgi:acyl-CoA synthetase (AMP-forming)/AMP-acid ligase II